MVSYRAAGALGAGDQMRFMMDPMAAMGGGAWSAFPGASLPAGGMPNAGLGLVPGESPSLTITLSHPCVCCFIDRTFHFCVVVSSGGHAFASSVDL